tara:strand:+ start:1223 stop:1822 length:600 start_codon:yes stop_codon:yes gene_type:complete
MYINSSYSFELDLAFTSPSDEVISLIEDDSVKNVLANPLPWEEDVYKWLSFLRLNNKLFCPEILRSTTLISLGLEFTDDKNLRLMNQTWRKKDQNTDVLSFPIIDENMILPTGEYLEIGDIIISVATAASQAKEMNHSLLFELRWLVSHGLLHLLGWDHPNPASLQQMIDCQNLLIDYSDGICDTNLTNKTLLDKSSYE